MAMRDYVKNTCGRYGLDPGCFSAHSLRKGGITRMGALGSSAEHTLADHESDIRPISKARAPRGKQPSDGAQANGHRCQALDTSKETVSVRTA
jgi:hypothetical protein